MLVPNALPMSSCLRSGVGVHLRRVSISPWYYKKRSSTDLPLATGHGDVDEAAGVSEPLLGAALGGLLLLLGLNLFQWVSDCAIPYRVPHSPLRAASSSCPSGCAWDGFGVAFDV